MADKPLIFEGPRRVVFGPGSVAGLGEEVKRLGGAKLLLVVDPVVAGLALFASVEASLKEAGIEKVIFSDFQPEPAPEEADAGAALARSESCDLVAGLGGGSAMDVAKAVAALAANPGRVEDYIGVDLVPGPGLPKIMVPTTAGTGSEATWTAVFTMRADKRKGGINSPFLYPETAILDPALTYELPAEVSAYTGLDALAHAIEAFSARRANLISDMYALEAIELIGQNLALVVAQGAAAPKAREGMLLGSFLAGKALAGAGVGACHGLAYPLGAFHGVGHGTANALLLAHVMRFNADALPDKFVAIARALGLGPEESAAEAVAELARKVNLPLSLREVGIPREALGPMSEAALGVKLCLDNNPKSMNLEQVIKVYEAAY